jgi:hypothetical protein
MVSKPVRTPMVRATASGTLWRRMPQAQPPLFTAGSHEFFDRAVAALNRHVGEVQRLEFPTEAHTFAIPEDEFTAFLRAVGEE